MRRSSFCSWSSWPASCRPRPRRGPWPVTGDVLRPFVFGDDPYAGGQHRGIDVAGDLGADVKAPASGDRVVRRHGAEGRQDAVDPDARRVHRDAAASRLVPRYARATR